MYMWNNVNINMTCNKIYTLFNINCYYYYPIHFHIFNLINIFIFIMKEI